jgi:hypothetical protein
MIFRPEQAGGIQAAPACDKRGVRIEEYGKVGECRDDLSFVGTHKRWCAMRCRIKIFQSWTPL